MIETDQTTYRVEECFLGTNFKWSDLGMREVIEKTVPLICDFNYDPDLIQFAKSKNQKLKALECIEQGENSWYWNGEWVMRTCFDPIFEKFPALAAKY